MSEFGIVQAGFVRKRYPEILSDMQARARANFGENIVTDTNKPLGKFLDIHAWALAELWEELEETYNSIAIDTASGVALDRLVKYKGLRRLTERASTVDITITGIPNTVVPLGFIVGKDDGTTYTNTKAGTIGSTGVITLPFLCNYVGSRGNAEVGEINLINTPITGINSVTNLRLVTNGQDFETDSMLRQRYIETVGGLSTVESIRAMVASVEGVVSVLVLENPTMEVNDRGIPPKAFEVYVYGGDDMEIAQAILDSKAAGIQAHGQTIIEPVDVNGYTHEIGFTRVDVIMIDVKVTITRNQYWPYNGIELIKQSILGYIGGEAPNGTRFSGLKINENVINSRVMSLTWTVGGVADVEVLIAKEGETLSDNNIIIGEFEIAKTSFDNIEVVFVT